MINLNSIPLNRMVVVSQRHTHHLVSIFRCEREPFNLYTIDGEQVNPFKIDRIMNITNHFYHTDKNYKWLIEESYDNEIALTIAASVQHLIKEGNLYSLPEYNKDEDPGLSYLRDILDQEYMVIELLMDKLGLYEEYEIGDDFESRYIYDPYDVIQINYSVARPLPF